jgi:hypothetical protein
MFKSVNLNVTSCAGFRSNQGLMLTSLRCDSHFPAIREMNPDRNTVETVNHSVIQIEPEDPRHFSASDKYDWKPLENLRLKIQLSVNSQLRLCLIRQCASHGPMVVLGSARQT